MNYTRLLIFLSITYCFLLPDSAHAALEWSLSVVQGYSMPNLKELNYVLKHSNVPLGPYNTEARPQAYPVIYQGDDPEMPEMSQKSPELGLQLQADINPRYAVVFGSSIAVFDSIKRDVRPFFVGFWIPATREIRFSLVLNQFWLGAKRYWTLGGELDDKDKSDDKDKKTAEEIKKRPAPRLYAEIGIFSITRAYLTTDVSMHVYAPDEGFDFYKVTETESSGSGYATYFGGGGEYYLTRWLSLSMDVNYRVGGIGDIKFVRYFTVDPLEKDIIKPGDDVIYTDLRKGRVVPLFIDIEGWDFNGHIRVYF